MGLKKFTYPPLPDFVVIGAMKAGTSTFHRNFCDIPPFSLTRYKEANFFLEDITTSRLGWYRRQFEGSGLRGDVSPKYSRRHLFPGVSERIYQLNPDAKIIYLVRDPIDRMLSHLHHNLLRDRYPGSRVEKEVQQNRDYILTSQYYFQIRPFLDFFPRENIHVIQFEALVNDTAVVLNRLYHFLEIELKAPITLRKYNDSDKRYKIKFHDWVHANVKPGWIKKAYHWFWYACNIQEKRPTLSQDSLSLIIEELTPDIEKFKNTFSLENKYWSKYAATLNAKPE